MPHTDALPAFKPTQRTRVHRTHQRGRYDRETVFAILDSAMMCHIGYVIDGQPYVTPTLFWRDGERLYWHGSSASRMLQSDNGDPGVRHGAPCRRAPGMTPDRSTGGPMTEFPQRQIGRTGLRVTELGLGCATLGGSSDRCRSRCCRGNRGRRLGRRRALCRYRAVLRGRSGRTMCR